MDHIDLQMWFVARIHNKTEEVQYYGGGGQFYPMRHDRTSLRIYKRESTAKMVVDFHAPGDKDWHYYWKPIDIFI